MHKADKAVATALAETIKKKVINTAKDHADHVIGMVDSDQREQVIKAISDDFYSGAVCMAKIMRDSLCPADLHRIKNALTLFVPRKPKKGVKGGKK